ncbi:hypothetical protein CMT41_18145 [Colwellia sp. MT41]|nr:hypothetical protein CMT41_18145 [Colwellia sp. MT41]
MQSNTKKLLNNLGDNCLEKHRYYALRKKLSLSSGNFVRAKITQQVELIEEQTFITVTVGKANISLPASTSVTYLSQLLRELIV